LIIGTLNDNKGLLFNSEGSSEIIVNTFDGFKSVFNVYVSKSKFTKFTSSSLITNPSSLTIITINFIPANNANGYLYIKFPLVDQYNQTKPIYSTDIGTGKSNGSIIYCISRNGFTGNIVCTLLIGIIGVN
jgi:hypothetical protein